MVGAGANGAATGAGVDAGTSAPLLRLQVADALAVLKELPSAASAEGPNPLQQQQEGDGGGGGAVSSPQLRLLLSRAHFSALLVHRAVTKEGLLALLVDVLQARGMRHCQFGNCVLCQALADIVNVRTYL